AQRERIWAWFKLCKSRCGSQPWNHFGAKRIGERKSVRCTFTVCKGMNNKQHIFLVEDDLSFGAVLKSYLEINDFEVTWVDDGKFATEKFRNGNYHICILDVMLPHVDGFSIAREIRKLNQEIPLVFLTAKTLKEDILKAYNVGADEYDTKPFDTEVLLCKIKANLNRKGEGIFSEKEVYEIATYRFYPKKRTIILDDDQQKLSPKEAELLKLLCQNMNELLPREIALRKIWGEDG